MSDTVFTLPGKLGDNIFKIPVVYQYCKQNNINKVDICLDKKSRILIDFLKTQNYINTAFYLDGILNYDMGGQPYNFGEETNGFLQNTYKKVYHLGFREYPYYNLTIESVIQSDIPIKLDNLLIEPSLNINFLTDKYLILHFEISGDNKNTLHRQKESIECVEQIIEKLTLIFPKIFIISTERDLSIYSNLLKYNNINILNDNGNLFQTAKLLAESYFIGTFGSMWALKSIIGGPLTVIMNEEDKLHNAMKIYDRDLDLIANKSTNSEILNHIKKYTNV